jgi:glycosyltransferase
MFQKKNNLIIRYWKAGTYIDEKIKKGWMPPHPTVFVKKKIFEKVGNYNTDYRISSDYDFLIRAVTNKEIKKQYLNQTLIKMRIGGTSNKSISNLLKKTFEDYKIIKKNKIGGFFTLFNKNYSKIKQFYQK